jgi:hypothetical protein
MNNFSTRNLAILAVSAIVAVGLLYWAFNVELVAALAITVIYTVVALLSMYLKGRSTS